MSTMVMILFVTVSAFATVKPNENARDATVALSKGRKVMKVCYVGTLKERVTINLYGQNGEIILTKKILSKEGFIQPFNFQGMKSGQYIFEVINSEGTFIEKVNYVKPVPNADLHLNVSKVSDTDKYELIVANQKRNNKITIQFLDKDYKALYKRLEENNDAFRQVYDLSAVKKDVKYVRVSNGMDIQIKEIN